jgi:hypothetical protein
MIGPNDNPYQAPQSNPAASDAASAGFRRKKRYGIWATVCVALGLLLSTGIPRNLQRLPPPGPERSGYYVGTFSLPAIFFVAAVALYRKQRRQEM